MHQDVVLEEEEVKGETVVVVLEPEATAFVQSAVRKLPISRE